MVPSTRARNYSFETTDATRRAYTTLHCTWHTVLRRFPMSLEFQQLFFTLYVTAPKLIRHEPPLGAAA